MRSLYRNFVAAYEPGFGNGARRRIYRALRSFIVKRYDPAIRMTVAGRELLMPFSHDLPIIIAQFPEYSKNVGRIARLIQRAYPDLMMIDVGANIGDTLAFVRAQVTVPTLCIEGDDVYFSFLTENVRECQKVWTANAFVGEKDYTIRAQVRSAHGTALITDGAGEIPIVRLTSLLERYPKFKTAKMLKIDVDGYDCAVIRGAIEYIAEAKPIVFFEYDPHALSVNGETGLEALFLLRSFGYSWILVYDNVGVLIGSVDLADENRLQDLDRYCRGRASKMYYDVAVFHTQDLILFSAAEVSEKLYFDRS